MERFLAINRDYLDEIYLSPGDVRAMKWDGRPVEVLFVDLAKTLALNDWVVRNWFPCLIPGESILIQQDLFPFCRNGGIAATMEYFRDCLEVKDYVYGASAVLPLY